MMKQNWIYKKIGEICEIKTGKLDANAAVENGIYPFFTCSKEPLSIDTYAYDCECILIAGNGDLNVKYYNGKFNAYQRTYILSLKTNVEDVSVMYLYAFFLLYVEELRKKSIGGIIKYIKLEHLRDALIPIPPLTLQQSIVAELDNINNLINIKKSQLKNLDNLAQSIFYEMFGDPVENEKGWDVKKLGEIAEFKNGLNFGKNERGYKYKFLGVSDFQNNDTLTSDSLMEVNLSEKISDDYLLRNGDIVFVRSNGSKELVGRNVLVKINQLTTFSGFCIRCRPSNSIINSLFLNDLFKNPSVRPLIIHSGRGCNISNLNQKILGDLPIPLPPLALQQKFAEKIEAIEKHKQIVNVTIKDLETLLASRMQFWFE